MGVSYWPKIVGRKFLKGRRHIWGKCIFWPQFLLAPGPRINSVQHEFPKFNLIWNSLLLTLLKCLHCWKQSWQCSTVDTAVTATTAHSAHPCYWSIKWCGTGRGRSRFDTTGTMIFADCPLCEKNIERNCAPWNFFIACVPFQKFYHCSSLAICVERKGKMAIRLYGPWSKNRWVDWGGFLFDC